MINYKKLKKELIATHDKEELTAFCLRFFEEETQISVKSGVRWELHESYGKYVPIAESQCKLIEKLEELADKL